MQSTMPSPSVSTVFRETVRLPVLVHAVAGSVAVTVYVVVANTPLASGFVMVVLFRKVGGLQATFALGGVHVKVRPFVGRTVAVTEHVAVLETPAVVAAQFVVVERMLNTAADEPRKPTCTFREEVAVPFW